MNSTPDAVRDVISAVDLAGVLTNAVLGGIAARAARLDIVGFVILAILSGLGGGMIRDALLQHGAVVALTDPYYLVVAIIGAVIAFFIPFKGTWPNRALVLLDALALGCWASVGVQKGLEAGLGWLPAVLLGMVTAVGGGMVRDVLLRKIPTVFGGNTLYATSAFVACIVMLALSELGLPAFGSIFATLAGAALSLLARRFGWVLPTEVKLPKPRPVSAWFSGWWGGRRRRERTPRR
ncbi:TRIC cation channel family protein [Microbacterium sp. STN6]|uniref:trimeric intracellular cation channel family protein n=1 Tax=Microbacterium sp. STN6 TaxID=2995588 RepID=UPI0022609437|nr:TRIC cation channel family protein [Microbacterium sp. STN6]MCX7522850.1 TRIC cation channel family protein [Microbacterium sp. STN6]